MWGNNKGASESRSKGTKAIRRWKDGDRGAGPTAGNIKMDQAPSEVESAGCD